MILVRYDSRGTRLAASLPFDPSPTAPAKLVPGFRYDANFVGAEKDQPAMKVWHWPTWSLPCILRTFTLVETRDPWVAAAIVRAKAVNASRVVTMDHARSLAATFDPRWTAPNGKRLRAHQAKAVLNTLRAGGSRGVFHETGTGKTITAGRLLSLLTVARDGLRKSVVVCPVTLIRAAWLPDLMSWFPELPIVNLRDHAKGSARTLAVAAAIQKHGRCVALVNYETAIADAAVRRVIAESYVVLDEASKAKGAESKIAKTLREMAPTFRGCLELSGTPAPNGNHEYWSLAKILAPAAGYDPFPGSLSTFNKEFCEVKTFRRRGEPGVEHFAGFEFKQEFAARVHERMAPICEWVKKEECLDLPAKVFQRVPIALEPATASAYEEMRDLMRVELGRKYKGDEDLRVHATNALAQMMKLRQITAGFVPAKKDEWIAGGEQSQVLLPLGREKIDWLLEHCETATDRIVVWTQFIFEAARYVEELAAAKVACASITGKTPERERAGLFDGFKRGDFQVLVAHPGVAQFGVSFPGVSHAAYGSLSYALQEFAQSQDRIHGIGRGDAAKHSTYYLLCATARGAETIDAGCMDVLEGKRDALDLVFQFDRERRSSGFVARDVGARTDAS